MNRQEKINEITRIYENLKNRKIVEKSDLKTINSVLKLDLNERAKKTGNLIFDIKSVNSKFEVAKSLEKKYPRKTFKLGKVILSDNSKALKNIKVVEEKKPKEFVRIINSLRNAKEKIENNVVEFVEEETKLFEKHPEENFNGLQKILTLKKNKRIIKNSKGFIQTASRKNRIFTTYDFEKESNLSILDWFIAIRFRLITEKESSVTPSVSYETYDSDNKFMHASLPKAMIQKLKESITYGDLDEIIEDFFLVAKVDESYDAQSLLINSNITKFTLLKLNNKIIGGIKIVSDAERKRSSADTHERYICRSPRSTNNNCLIEAFKFICSDTDTKANKIRAQYKLKDGPLNVNICPILEKHFNIKVSVICGDFDRKFKDEDGEECIEKLPIVGYVNGKYKNLTLQDYRDADKCEHQIFYEKNEKCPDGHYSVVCQKLDMNTPVLTEGDKLRKESIEVGKMRFNKETNKMDILKDKKFISLDYETITAKEGYLVPYSCSMTISEENGKLIENKIYVGPGTNKAVVDHLLRLSENNFNKSVYYINAYNGAKFDHYILLEELAKRNLVYKTGIFIANGAILKMAFLDFIVIDLCRFTMMSLKDALEGFKCKVSKLSFDHTIPQKAYNKGRLSEWIKANIKELREYNTADTEGLAELFFKVRDAVRNISKLMIDEEIFIEDCLTISSLANKLWKKTLPNLSKKAKYKGEPIVFPPGTRTTAYFVKKAFFGGRSQIFRKEYYKGLDFLQSLDVKSLYPFVMEFCDYPIGNEIITQSYIPEKLGIYFCKIISQPKTKVIPYRCKDKPLNWDYYGSFYNVLSTVDIDLIRDFGGEVEIVKYGEYKLFTVDDPMRKLKIFGGEDSHEEFNDEDIGIFWEEKSKRVFEGYVKILREKKTDQDILAKTGDKKYNPALRSMLKLLLNSLSGKVGQREFDTDTSFCTDFYQQQKFFKEHTDVQVTPISNLASLILKGEKNSEYNVKTAKPWQLSVFIYAYSRAHMYRSVLSKIGTKYATDTDSCHAHESDISKLVDEGHHDNGADRFGKFHEGGEFGDFEKEIGFKASNAIYIAPKCYALFSDDYKNKIAEAIKKCINEKKDYDPKKIQDNFCKMRFKGISPRDRTLIINEEFINYLNLNLNVDEVVSKKNIHTFTQLTNQLKKVEFATDLFSRLSMDKKLDCYESRQSALDKEFYERLHNNELVTVISSRIEKKIGNHSIANLKGVFMIKSAHKSGLVNLSAPHQK